MLARIRSAVDVARRVAAVARDQEVTFLAASVAYYAFVSLIPAIVLLLVVAATLGGADVASAVLTATGEFLTESGRDVISRALESGEGRGSTTLLGLVVLLWGTLKVFRGLDTAFSKVYGVDHEESLLEQVTDALVVVVSVGLTMLLMVVLGGLLAALRLGPVVEALGVVALPLVLTLAFLPMYYRFPDVPIGLWEAVPGAVFAGVGWTLLQALFQVYAGMASHGAYGIVGGVILLVTWLYFAGVVVVLGAVINVVLAADREPEEPGEGAATDRQYQGPRVPADEHMAEREPTGAPDVSELEDRIEELRADLDAFEHDVEERTVERPRVEENLKQYVRREIRRGHARGWGPYLVLLYGTVMTLGAFYWLTGWPAVVSMFVIFTSTLGLYVLFVLFGGVLGALSAVGGVLGKLRGR